MSTNAGAILTQPGYLIWAATDLSIVSPHGGTNLGYTKDGVRLIISQEDREIKAEETGVAIQEIIAIGSNITIEATLYQTDDNVLAKVFHNTATGGVSGNKVLEFPGSTYYPGAKLSAKAGVLVFSPVDLTNNKVILLRNAIPSAKIPLNLDFAVSKDTAYDVAFRGLPDTSIGSGDGRYDSRTCAIGDRRDITI